MLLVDLQTQQGTVLLLSRGLARVHPDDARLRYCAGLGLSQGEDDQDRFSQLQQTVLPEGPDSISFYNAKVKTEQKVTWDIHVYEAGGPKDYITRTPRITNPTGWVGIDGTNPGRLSVTLSL